MFLLEKHESIPMNFVDPFIKRLDDTNGNVNDASAKNVDAIIPEVPQIDTNENVNEVTIFNRRHISFCTIS
jgi:hypothetical protein